MWPGLRSCVCGVKSTTRPVCHPAPFISELVFPKCTQLHYLPQLYYRLSERSGHPQNKPVAIFARVLTGGFQGLPECQSVLLQDITSSCSAAVCLWCPVLVYLYSQHYRSIFTPCFKGRKSGLKDGLIKNKRKRLPGLWNLGCSECVYV